MQRIEATQKITYEEFFSTINQFLIPYGIHPLNCDVLEDILLNLSGVTVHPTKSTCGRDRTNTNFSLPFSFQFEGIEKVDMETFIKFYQKNSALSSKFTYDDVTKTAKIIFELEGVAKLIPAFKSAFLSLPNEKLEHYRNLSKDNKDVKEYQAAHKEHITSSGVTGAASTSLSENPSALFHLSNHSTSGPASSQYSKRPSP